MNWFKRLCLFLFGLCGLASLAALVLTWVGPWTTQFRSYLEIAWYFYTLEAMVIVAGVGLLFCVLYALFKPRNPKETVIATLPGGQISVRRSAIVSQTRHLIEADGSCVATQVKVHMSKRGRIKVRAIVTPRYPINVAERSITLHEELEQGLAQVCADGVRSIVLVFKEPQQLEVPGESEEVETYIDENGEEVRVIVQSGTKVISNKRAAEITIAPEELATLIGKNKVKDIEATLPTIIETVPELEVEVAEQSMEQGAEQSVEPAEEDLTGSEDSTVSFEQPEVERTW